ncbi:MAG TPA: glycosyltransferase [Candidatus Hydrogenedentes bacterium]|nr:glycosyltransferase [Candidatus Hydrogenedentota bacterium]
MGRPEEKGRLVFHPMTYLVYDTALSIAAAPAAAWLALRRKHRPLLRRFSPSLPANCRRPIWMQACSVGEVATARPIVAAMRVRWPGVPIVLTASTAAGHALAQSDAAGATVAWFPFDHPWVVRRFVRRLDPLALVLVETEVWPNVLREMCRHGAPVIIITGRLSDKHFRRYLRARTLLRPVFRQIRVAGMQNEEYAERLAALGVPPTAIHVTGNTKFDGVTSSIPDEVCTSIRNENGFPENAPILLFGSTRPGDEALAATSLRRLRTRSPELRLILAPRHVERADQAAGLFNEPVLRRSEVCKGAKPRDERVFVLDTLGELRTFYGIATIAVVGGSFFPGVDGHNPLEPAALGTPTVFGPYMRNFEDLARALTDRQGACQVAAADELPAALERLLADDAERARIGANARAAVLANQGAVERNLDLLAGVLDAEEAGNRQNRTFP